MNEIKEHDTVIVDGNKFGTVVHIYPDNNTCEVEIFYFNENEIKTVTKDKLILVKK
jgi:hypothetical protein